MRVALAGFLILATLSCTGCGSMLNHLRRDLDEPEYDPEPTFGGRWSERSFLRADRGPAGEESADSGKGGRAGSWARPDSRRGARGGNADLEAAGRDSLDSPDSEDAVRFSRNPDVAPPVVRQYKNGPRATRADFLDESASEGSLWASDGQTNYYFTKNKIRTAGDIIQVTIEDQLFRDAALEIRRTLSPREREAEMDLAQERLRKKAIGLAEPDSAKGAQASAAADAGSSRAPAGQEGDGSKQEKKEPEIPRATYADIDVARSIELKTGDVMMAEIIERYPNGNYKIRGTKRVVYKTGAPRLLTLTGIVRGSDISEEEVLASGKLYEYRLEALR